MVPFTDDADFDVRPAGASMIGISVFHALLTSAELVSPTLTPATPSGVTRAGSRLSSDPKQPDIPIANAHEPTTPVHRATRRSRPRSVDDRSRSLTAMMLGRRLIRPLALEEVERVADVLGLARLHQGDGFYLVAWDGDERSATSTWR